MKPEERGKCPRCGREGVTDRHLRPGSFVPCWEPDKPDNQTAKDAQMFATMPAPDALVKDEHGNICAAMFYFAPGDTDLGMIASEFGFDCKSVRMEDEIGEDHELSIAYADGSSEVVDKWEPTTPDGWTFGIKMDTEDGPVALFVRRRDDETPQ